MSKVPLAGIPLQIYRALPMQTESFIPGKDASLESTIPASPPAIAALH